MIFWTLRYRTQAASPYYVVDDKSEQLHKKGRALLQPTLPTSLSRMWLSISCKYVTTIVWIGLVHFPRLATSSNLLTQRLRSDKPSQRHPIWFRLSSSFSSNCFFSFSYFGSMFRFLVCSHYRVVFVREKKFLASAFFIRVKS